MDYSNREYYLLRGEVPYRTDRYFYPNGNNPKTYYNDQGNGRGSNLPDPAATAIGNPMIACYEQPPITWMENMPVYRDKNGQKKFSDTFFYKNHLFAPGNN